MGFLTDTEYQLEGMNDPLIKLTGIKNDPFTKGTTYPVYINPSHVVSVIERDSFPTENLSFTILDDGSLVDGVSEEDRYKHTSISLVNNTTIPVLESSTEILKRIKLTKVRSRIQNDPGPL